MTLLLNAVDGEMPAYWIPVIALGGLVFFCLLWIAIMWIMSRSGWRRFASGLECATAPDGCRAHVTNLTFGGLASYNNVVTGVFGPQGIHLRTWRIFGMFHPPLLIPWELLQQGRPRSYLIVTLYELEANANGVRCRIRLTRPMYRKVADFIPAELRVPGLSV